MAIEDGAEDALLELKALMRCEDDKVRFAAVKYWLDRALGKPHQSVHVEKPPSELPLHEQEAMLREALDVIEAEKAIGAAVAKATSEPAN